LTVKIIAVKKEIMKKEDGERHKGTMCRDYKLLRSQYVQRCSSVVVKEDDIVRSCRRAEWIGVI
jgi:hypothetical protein